MYMFGSNCWVEWGLDWNGVDVGGWRARRWLEGWVEMGLYEFEEIAFETVGLEWGGYGGGNGGTCAGYGEGDGLGVGWVWGRMAI